MAVRRDMQERFLEYAARIVKLVESLPKTPVGRRIGDQLLLSATAVGANYEEARGAESTGDFIHKLQVALKELRESNYWLQLILKARIFSPRRLAGIINESAQLRAMLPKAVATAKGKAKRQGLGKP